MHERIHTSNLANLETATERRILDWVSSQLESRTASCLAKFLDIHNAHIYAAKGGYVGPTLKRAVIKKGVFAAPPARKRFACDIPPWMSPDQITQYRKLMREYATIAQHQVRGVSIGDGDFVTGGEVVSDD